jgi:hypothetical protein
MPTVTVDLEDLRKLVYATGAMKAIEGILDTRKRDPFVELGKPFTEAHDRIAAAMRDIDRGNADTAVKYNEPLTEEEYKALKNLDGWITRKQKAPDPKKNETMSVWDRLAAKGCVVIGQAVTGIVWAGAPSVSDVIANPDKFPIRLTERGKVALSVGVVKEKV